MIESLEPRCLLSGTFYVAVTGSDTAAGSLTHPFKTIQHALDIADAPGDTIMVRAGTYNQRLTFPASGSASGGYITLENYPGEQVTLSGQNAADDDVGFGENMIQIFNKSYIKVSGLYITDDNGIAVGDDASGVFIEGSGSHIQIVDNTISNITGKVLSTSGGLNNGYAGSGIQVYGSSVTSPYSNLTLSHNTIFDCQPGDDSTETLTVNGNITNFFINYNTIHDCNNIGIDMVGGEADAFNKPDGTQNLPQARDGECEFNTVYNIHANYGGGYAAGIYVDGGQNIIVQANHVSACDLGIEVGCENHGYVASGDAVRDNILDLNTQAGLVFGGYDPTVGRVEDCTFTNNTLYHNDTTSQGNGEVWIQYATGNVLENNIIFSTSQDLLINSQFDTDNTSEYNLLYCADGASNAQFLWGGTSYSSFAAYQAGSKQDQAGKSIFAAPKFVAPAQGNFNLTSISPAINAGNPSFVAAPGETDFFGDPRVVGGRVDIGAVEFSGK
jgi:hypothetical protein